MHFDTDTFDAESARKASFESARVEAGFGDIEDRLATRANEMVMRLEVGFEALRAMMEAHIAKDAGLEERLYVLVNRAEGDGRDLEADALVDRFGTRMAAHAQHFAVDDAALMREGEALIAAERGEVLDVFVERGRGGDRFHIPIV